MREISKESTIRQRIMQLCDYYNISPNKLSLDVGYNRNYVSRITDTIPFDMMLHIYRTFDQINIEWLLTGNGKMLNLSMVEEQSMKSLLEMLNAQLQRNEKLHEEMKELREKLSSVADIARCKESNNL